MRLIAEVAPRKVCMIVVSGTAEPKQPVASVRASAIAAAESVHNHVSETESTFEKWMTCARC